MTRATVTYCGVRLDCTFEYSPPEERTWDDPGGPANAALESCKVAGADIFEMLTREQQDEIETLLIEAHGEQLEVDAGEAADLRRTERAMEGFIS